MNRILFCSTHGDGHVLPMLPLASAFAARGDEVTFAASANHRDRIERLDLRFANAGPTFDDLKPELEAHRAKTTSVSPAIRRPIAFTGRFAEIEAPRRMVDLQALVDADRPDLLIHESADLAAPIAAASAGIPSVNHAFGLPIPEPALRRAAEAMSPFWRAAGLEPDEYAGAYRGAYVGICPPSFRPELPLAGVRIHHVRPAAAAPSATAARDRPRVYATLGTSFNTLDTFRVLLDAFEAIDCDVTVTIGRNRDPRDLEPPENVIVERYIPQGEILPMCDAVVTHAGSGTLFATLAQGLPLVLLPSGADQFENAATCSSLGVAETILPGELAVERVRDATVRVLTEPSFRAAATSIAAEIAAMPSPDAAADELISHL
jgi:UDP:flavonoid glycosyltransferase YjiC (YdhE family)